jgi:hypothetical protein
MLRILYLVAVFLVFPVIAFSGQKVLLTMSAPAEGTAESSSHSMSFEYLDEQTARIEVSLDGKHNGTSYTLFRDGKVYSVSNLRGKVMVVDISSMKGVRNITGRSNPNPGTFEIKLLELSPTGKGESVAGIEGDVYQIVWRDEKGKLHDETAVLSSDPRAKEWTTQWLKASNEMQRAILGKAPESNISDRLKQEGKGLLRLGTSLRVTSLTPSRNNNQFELPAEPVSVPDFGAGMQTQGGEAAQEEKNVLSKKMERQKQRQEERIDSRVDETVDKSMDKAVDKTLDKVFKGLGGLFE